MIIVLFQAVFQASMPLASRGLASRKAVYNACKASRLISTSSQQNQKNHISLKNPSTTSVPKASVVSVASTAPSSVSEEVERCFKKLDLSFKNYREAFKVCSLSKGRNICLCKNRF